MTAECPLLAQSGHALVHRECPLLGVKRTSFGEKQTSFATVDEASGKIGIKLDGTVGSGDTTAPTSFKVQDGLHFNAARPSDKVSIVVERIGDAMTIKKLAKD